MSMITRSMHKKCVMKYGRYFAVYQTLDDTYELADITNQIPHMKNKLRMLTELLNKDADIVFKCEACSISIVRNSRAHDHCICDEDGERWWCEDCYDHYQQDGWSSEEEEEDIDICGETGGLLKGFKGCGDKFDTQDTNMLGNTSFCVECYNKHEDTYYKEEDIVETKTQFDVKVST